MLPKKRQQTYVYTNWRVRYGPRAYLVHVKRDGREKIVLYDKHPTVTKGYYWDILSSPEAFDIEEFWPFADSDEEVKMIAPGEFFS